MNAVALALILILKTWLGDIVQLPRLDFELLKSGLIWYPAINRFKTS